MVKNARWLERMGIVFSKDHCTLTKRQALAGILRRSVASERATRPQAKKGKKRMEGQREMLLTNPGKKGKEAAKPVARATARQKRVG